MSTSTKEEIARVKAATAFLASVHGAYVPDQAKPAAQKQTPTFWDSFDECDESGQL